MAENLWSRGDEWTKPVIHLHILSGRSSKTWTWPPMWQPSCCDKACQPTPSSVIQGRTCEKGFGWFENILLLTMWQMLRTSCWQQCDTCWRKRCPKVNLSCDWPWPTTRYPFWYPRPLSKATRKPKFMVVKAHRVWDIASFATLKKKIGVKSIILGPFSASLGGVS